MLMEGLDDAIQGRGAVWFLSGEPGIGKSRLAEETSRCGMEREMRVLWGRCWEVGGAPAFYPWIQLLRDLLTDDSDLRSRVNGLVIAHIAHLLPELRQTGVPELPPLPPEQARFELLDAVARLVTESAAQKPLLLLLEDLHASDKSSLLLLEFVQRQVRTSAVMVVGTYRETQGDAAYVLQRLSQQARLIALRRFDGHEVRQLLEGVVGEDVAGRIVEEVIRTTEGNPLFLVELARYLARCGSEAEMLAAARPEAVPLGIKTAIEQRLSTLDHATRDELELAAVIGREFSVAIICRAFRRDTVAVQAALRRAADASVVTVAGADRYRFAHVMIREVLHQAMDRPAREARHFDVARALEDENEAHAECAYHYAEAGEQGCHGAIAMNARTAEDALTRHAYQESVEGFRRALAVLDRMGTGAPADMRFELMLGLGRSLLANGDVQEGRRTCLIAATVARALQRREGVAEAALAYGNVFVFASVDETLVGLLREGLERLGRDDSPLRARVMARLSAAMQPAEDPTIPVAMAREAIDLARRIGDPDTLLDALRSGCSSMMDLVSPRIRKAYNEEHVAIASSLSNPAEEFRGLVRLVFDYLELGEGAAARGAIDRVRRLAVALGHPYYTWRAKSFDAMLALWEGALDRAECCVLEVERLGEASRDPNARCAALFQRARLMTLRGRAEEVAKLIPRIDRMYEGTPQAEALARIYAHGFRVDVGIDDQLVRAIADVHVDAAFRLRDQTTLLWLARWAVDREDRELAARIYDRLGEDPELMLTGGVAGATWEGPRAWPQAMVAVLLERHDEAEDLFRDAARSARRLGGEAVWACIVADSVAMLGADRIDHAMAREASERARELGLVRVVEKLAKVRRAAVTALPSASPAPLPWSIRPDGEIWIVRCGDRVFRLRGVKGLKILARLVEAPGQAFHVLDLEYPNRDTVDPGGGELIDERARSEYRARLAELREDLADAEENNDLGRAERAREELGVLEQHLAEAIGLGGRYRRATDATERARVNVQRRLRDAIRRIGAQDERLGRHLSLHVRTGTFCHYE